MNHSVGHTKQTQEETFDRHCLGGRGRDNRGTSDNAIRVFEVGVILRTLGISPEASNVNERTLLSKSAKVHETKHQEESYRTSKQRSKQSTSSGTTKERSNARKKKEKGAPKIDEFLNQSCTPAEQSYTSRAFRKPKNDDILPQLSEQAVRNRQAASVRSTILVSGTHVDASESDAISWNGGIDEVATNDPNPSLVRPTSELDCDDDLLSCFDSTVPSPQSNQYRKHKGSALEQTKNHQYKVFETGDLPSLDAALWTSEAKRLSMAETLRSEDEANGIPKSTSIWHVFFCQRT